MRRLVTGKQMKEIDAYAIQTIGILSMVLMERAALAVADELMQEYQRRGRKPGLAEIPAALQVIEKNGGT